MKPIDHRRFKDHVYQDLARVASALSSPRRLEMMDLLAQRERSVEDLAGELGLSVANASAHLKVLISARLVETRRAGTFRFYRLASSSALRLLRLVGDVAEERLPEVRATLDRYLGNRQIDPVSLRSVAQRVKDGKAVLLDVRPEAEYRAGHIPGARSVPIDLLARKRSAGVLPPRREILAYCRGPYCVWADEAVAILRRQGRRARRLRLGAADWAALGEELETAG